MSIYYRNHFQFPTLHPTAPKSPRIWDDIMERPINVFFICRTCKGCRAHSRDTKMIPVVPRLALVSYI